MASTNSNDEEVFHRLRLTTYFSPTFCDYCGHFLYGLVRQGLKCESCNENYHKHCANMMPKICNRRLQIKVSVNPSSNQQNPTLVQLISSININATSASTTPLSPKKFLIEHSFNKRNLTQFRLQQLVCDVCNEKIKTKYYWYCTDCKINVHEKCTQMAEKNCQKKLNDDDTVGAYDDVLETGNCKNETESVISDINEETDSQVEASLNDNNPNHVQQQNNTNKPRYKQRKGNQILLQRVSQRVKKHAEFFWRGHMIYSLNTNTEPTTHYWQLDSKTIHVYDTYKLANKLFEIPLNTIEKAMLSDLNQKNANKCLFYLQTEKITYYCGLDNSNPNNTMNQLARNFYNIFKMVFLPYARGSKQSIKIMAPRYEEKSLSEEYIINPQEELGSGQFGQVYGGLCKATKEQVAIKVIDKTRFQDFRTETSIFQNEITILYNVQHPGIVKLHMLFDEGDHLYIVTERLATDMLEMILSRRPARLNERIAKFLAYQILSALKLLHDRHIAHCDLKPENILLTENSDFPQVKLCDFGYAKIIGENSFRRSLVGTPAYSPPEVKQKRVFNKSMDMWSMGVIVYVSLSGVFPFEEDRDIYEQIRNSNFMFPSDPWDTISKEAVDLIKTEFLQVSIDRRAPVPKALKHSWFSQDRQLHLDLKDLERRCNQTWLTNDEQQAKWKNTQNSENTYL